MGKLAVSKNEEQLLNKSARAWSTRQDPANHLSSSSPKFSLLYALSAAVLCVCFVVPLYLRSDHPPRSGPRYLVQQASLDPFGDSVYRQEAYYAQLEPGTQCKPKSVFSSELFQTPALTNMALEQEAKRMAAEFEYSTDDLNKGVTHFLAEMHDGLEKQGTHISQIPTYVTAVPNGTEKGTFLAVDLGGTNFRVCSITLNGDHTFSLTQSKVAVPRALMETQVAAELFGFMAKQIEIFLQTHHADHFETHKSKPGEVPFFDLGFTFSFPVEQVGINKGRLVRWTKGFNIQEAIGQDVCDLLQKEIKALNLPVTVSALVNDTVGTLMARSYTSPGNESTLLGAIFGTGTNGAYVEQLSNVKKMKMIDEQEGGASYDTSTGLMIVNTEWGSFDNALHVLPDTPYDRSLDQESNNPGIQMFEKRVSGMFLGEILRRAVLALHRHHNPDVAFLKDKSSADNDMASTTTIDPESPLFKQWGIDTSFLSIVEEDQSDHLRITKQILERDLGVSAAATEDAIAIKMLVHAIGRRAARLAAVALGAVVIKSQRLATHGLADIGVDGSLVEYYPGFEDYIREAFREMDGIGPAGETKIRIGLAKDGSGLGAALIALVAHQAEKGGGA